MPKVMWGPYELATRTAVRAMYAQGHLVIEADGEVPSPGDTPEIIDVPPSNGTPSFEVVRVLGAVTGRDLTVPFSVKEVFPVDNRPASVEVRHAGGVDKVDVTDADRGLAAFLASLPHRGHGAAEGDEATGYSRHMSYDEAFADALFNLPPADASRVERLTVVESGAVRGGGFDHLYVKVRRHRA